MLSTPQLADVVRGRVIVPGDAEYDRARTVFSGAIDRRPAAIVQVADAADVARVVAHARETGLELAVRSGGHGLAGHAVTEGGIVIDLSAMRRLEIDAARRVAWAEAGLTTGAYTLAAGEHGLATGFGDTGSVGIGGITLAGGAGLLVRKHGLTIDHLLAAEIVTAGGDVLHVDADTHPDLFWAIRGGGGNVGVVTRLRFRLHDVPQVVGGMLILPATADVVAGFVAETDAAPDELSAIANVMKAPPLPFLPPEQHGRPALMALLAYAGAVEDGTRAVDRLRALAPPVADMVRPTPYAGVFPPEPEDFHPVATMRTMFLDTVDRHEAEAILGHLEASTAQMAVAQLRVLGGAMARVPADATAFAHRRSRIMANVTAVHARGDDPAPHEAWVAGLAGAIGGDGAGAYAGFLADEGPDRVRAAYPGATWDRLAAIKARHDPDNLFRLNQNVPPDAGDR
jgi:FAD/FMN-containing dehydrogenase